MNPLHFGSPERQLFGLHHPPEGNAVRGVGVVLAHPAPQEYMRTYWALRRLASQLAAEGFHVLRFDYAGTGDSSGELADADLAGWRSDLGRAVAELRELSEGLPISVVGVRLGAGLALASPELALRDLVLWEPVAKGRSMVNRLRALHAERHPTGPSSEAELLGFPFSPRLSADLDSFDALAGGRCEARRVVVLEVEPGDGAAIHKRLSAEGAAVDAVTPPDRAAASRHADLNTSLIAPSTLQLIGERLARPIP